MIQIHEELVCFVYYFIRILKKADLGCNPVNISVYNRTISLIKVFQISILGCTNENAGLVACVFCYLCYN